MDRSPSGTRCRKLCKPFPRTNFGTRVSRNWADARGRKQIKPLRVLRRNGHVLKHGASKHNEIKMVAPTGFGPVFESRLRFRWSLSHVTTCWVAKESTRLKHAAEKLVGRHALSPDSAPSPREPPLRRAVATTPARPRAAVPRRARRALAATSARAHRCPSIGRPSRG